MRSILALIRVSWLHYVSYRLNLLGSLLSLVATFIPVYFVAGALQPVVAESIADEGGVYFGFLITGMAVVQLVSSSMTTLPNSVSSGIASGTLEALLATPVPLTRLLIGMQGYAFLWTLVRSILLLLGFVVIGGVVSWHNLPAAIIVVSLLVLAHVPVALVATSLILIFRTAGPFLAAAAAGVNLLGGVYYSTDVIPEVIRPLSAIMPMTYGLRAFRRLFLSGATPAEVAPDVATLAVMAVVLLACGALLFRWSLAYAKRVGSLAQY